MAEHYEVEFRSPHKLPVRAPARTLDEARRTIQIVGGLSKRAGRIIRVRADGTREVVG